VEKNKHIEKYKGKNWEGQLSDDRNPPKRKNIMGEANAKEGTSLHARWGALICALKNTMTEHGKCSAVTYLKKRGKVIVYPG